MPMGRGGSDCARVVGAGAGDGRGFGVHGYASAGEWSLDPLESIH